MYWGDLAWEPLDPGELRRVRELNIEYSKLLEVHEKVAIQEAREGGRQVLGHVGKVSGGPMGRTGPDM